MQLGFKMDMQNFTLYITKMAWLCIVAGFVRCLLSGIYLTIHQGSGYTVNTLDYHNMTQRYKENVSDGNQEIEGRIVIKVQGRNIHYQTSREYLVRYSSTKDYIPQKHIYHTLLDSLNETKNELTPGINQEYRNNAILSSRRGEEYRTSSRVYQTNNGIPHIVHQAFDDVTLPGQVENWVRSWGDLNPRWRHWFWTESSARHLIGKNYTQFLDLYDQYPYKINRADVRRYFILYEHGGVYADLDVECLKPLDDIVSRFPCIIAQEPAEHQVLLYDSTTASIFAMPAFMACRPHHPFFKFLISQLSHFIFLAWKLPWNENILRSTGPHFVSQVLANYQKQHNNSKGQDYVYLAPPHWFMPTYDATNSGSFHRKCANISWVKEDLDRIKVCARIRDQVIHKEAFTNHHWLHSWGNTFQTNTTFNVKSLQPAVTLV